MRVLLSLLVVFVAPIVLYAAPVSNAGFIPAPLWFSRDTFFAGESVRVYTVVYNGSDSDIRGTVEFLNSGQVIGSDDFSLAQGGRSQDIWIDWKASEGEHRISARIVRAAVSGGAEESINLSQTATPEVRVSVDTDTDKDGMGNKTDDDDDNDGVSDKDEERAGTNPLVKDAPPKTENKQESVSYPTVSPIDKIAEIATEKTEDAGSTALAFTESAREKGSAIFDRKTDEARKEVENLRASKNAELTESKTQSATEEPPAQGSRARQIADERAGQSIWKRVSDSISTVFSKATDVFGKKDSSETSGDKVSASAFQSVHIPFAYLKLFLYATLAFLFRHAIFFYLFLIFFAYILTRTLIRFVRSR